MSAQLISRVRGLILTPKSEWETIAAEPAPLGPTYTGYIIPLVLIGVVAGFIGGSLIGFEAFGQTYRTPIGAGLTQAVLQVALTLGGVYVFALIVNMLAPSFGAEKNFDNAFKVAAFYPTAGWLAGVFALIPVLGILTLVGAVYTLYLLFVGLPTVMKPAEDKGVAYTLSALAIAIVLWIVIGLVVGAMAPRSAGIGAAAGGDAARTAALERAAESGDIGAMIGAMSGAESAEPIAVDDLRALMPERLRGLERDAIATEELTFPVQATVVTAHFADGEKTLDVQITQSSALSSLMAIGGLGGNTYNRQSGDDFERLSRDGDEMRAESWKEVSQAGSIGRSVNGRVLVTVESQNMSFQELERAVDDLISRDLERLTR